MLNIICPQNCPQPYCQSVCPTGAILTKDKKVYIECDKCIGCNECRTICMTFSEYKALKEKNKDWLMGKV